MDFLGDQGRDVVVVRSFLTKGDLMAIGPQTSVGNMYLGPLFYYLIAPSLLIANYNPVGPSILIALFGIATCILLYIFTSQIFDSKTGLVASYLFAISPVIIKYNTFSWNPNIMPFFSLLFAYSLYQFTFHKKLYYLIIASISFIFCLNSHYLALLLLPFAFIYLIYYIKNNKVTKIFWKVSAISIILFILSVIPQILFDIKHHGQNIQAIISYLFSPKISQEPQVSNNIFSLFTLAITRLGAAKNLFFGLLLTIYTSISTFFIFKNYSSKRFSFVFILVWIFTGLFGLSFLSQNINDHYYIFLFTPIIILLSLTITRIKYIGIFVLLLITLYSLKENPLNNQPNRQLATTRLVTESIIQKSQNQPFNLALIAKQNYDPPYRYFIELNHSPLFTLTEKVTDQLFVICENTQNECKPLGHPFWDIAAFGVAKIHSQWTVNNITIYKLIHS